MSDMTVTMHVEAHVAFARGKQNKTLRLGDTEHERFNLHSIRVIIIDYILVERTLN